MMVTPAWRILELINSTAFQDERDRCDAYVAELRRGGHGTPNPEPA
jgi:hypothetical protein